jgi:Domain of unknown function (DUF1844)
MSDPAMPQEPMDAAAVFPELIEVLASLAWQKLGLHADTITGRTVQQLDQAKLCIDGVAALAGLIEPQLEPGDQRRLRSLVTDLRLNFVQQTELAKERASSAP